MTKKVLYDLSHQNSFILDDLARLESDVELGLGLLRRLQVLQLQLGQLNRQRVVRVDVFEVFLRLVVGPRSGLVFGVSLRSRLSYVSLSLPTKRPNKLERLPGQAFST